LNFVFLLYSFREDWTRKDFNFSTKKPLYIYDVPLHDDIHELRVKLNAPAHMVCFLTVNQRRAAAKERMESTLWKFISFFFFT
jgi:hypothetical protein